MQFMLQPAHFTVKLSCCLCMHHLITVAVPALKKNHMRGEQCKIKAQSQLKI